MQTMPQRNCKQKVLIRSIAKGIKKRKGWEIEIPEVTG